MNTEFPCGRLHPLHTRREMLRHLSCGFGALAFSALAARTAETNPLAPKPTHFAARAKRVIFLCMRGGP